MNADAPTHDYFAVANQADEIPAPDSFVKQAFVPDDPELQAELEKFQAEVQAQMEAHDPREDHYMMRLDSKTLIKTHAEFEYCQKNGIPLKYGISYGHALHLLAEEGARNTAKKKRRAKNKIARKQRKLNRK